MTRTSSSENGIDEILAMITMPVIGLSVCPGFLLCVPGLLMVVLPIVALGLLAMALGLVVAALVAPLLLARVVVRRLTQSIRSSAPAPALATRSVPASPNRAVALR